MNWIAGKPTEDGWYWIRMDCCSFVEVARFYVEEDDYDLCNEVPCRYAGNSITHYIPIEEPDIPK